MFEAIQTYVPMEWRRTLEFLGAPLWWIPEWQEMLLGSTLFGVTAFDAALRRVFLLLPALLLVVGVWMTMTALYTLPFRSHRGRFVTTMALTWWDGGRTIWFFWAGVVRVLMVVVGWVWSLLRLAWRMLKGIVTGTVASPFMLLDWTSRKYFKPGVPWIAFLLTLAWSALEATIFTYILLPTITEVLDGLTGFQSNRAIVTPMLWLLLFVLIAGSFACIDVLGQALRSRNFQQIAVMTFVEFAVMLFEVLFLYRELIASITPWIAQQTGGALQLGLVPTLALAAFGWVGVRGMTWFLFGRYGTPALVAVVSRETITQTEPAAYEAAPPTPTAFRDAVAALKSEVDWFKREARSVFELLTLPILQLLAAAVNFAVVVVRGQPVFQLPFTDLDDVLAATPLGDAGSSSGRRSRSSASAPAAAGAAGRG
jgi:hypothetical protein